MNNKGFTMVEILAVVMIIGILSSVAVVGVSRYRDQAQKKDLDALVYSTISAFDEYLIDHPDETSAFSSTLTEGQYLSNDTDPYDKENTCTIRIERINIDSNVGTESTLDHNEYKIYVCCANRTKNYTFTKRTKDDDSLDLTMNHDGQCQAGYDIDKLYSSTNSELLNNITSGSSSVYKIKKPSIYTMEEMGKDCNNTGGIMNTYCITSECEDGTGKVRERVYNPYRKYDYHIYGCTCYYNKSDGGYAGYGRRTEKDSSHTMIVFYLNNSHGKNACTSDDTSLFNKYVDHICTWGVFLNGATQINFHGYQWYRDNSGAYGSFTPNGFWYHDYEPFEWKAVKEPGDDVDTGCAKTCLYMTPYWGGKIE